MLDHYDGTTWSLASSPNASTFDSLSAITCVSATNCWAVGYERNSSNVDQTLTEHFDGTSWSVVTSPDVGTNQQNDLYSVTCGAAADCWAVGQYFDTNGVNHTLGEHYNGTVWSVVSTPSPGNPLYGDQLHGVTCNSATDCWAAGDYWATANSELTLIIHYDGAAWTTVSSPNVASYNVPQAVTCASATNCWAVGHYQSANLETLVLHYIGYAWIVDGTPIGGYVTPQENPGGGNPSEPSACSSQGSAGDPCNTASGSFSESTTDLSIPGRGLLLSLTRTYSSVFAATNGPLGYGWTDSYNMSLSVNGSTGVVTVSQENGSQVTFTPASGGGYTAPPRVIATLTHNGDGSFTLVRQARHTFTFSAAGQLTSERDLNGYTTSLAYNGSGQLATVSDSANRHLTFAYTGTHLTSVTDPASRVVSYSYDSSGNLSQVTDVGNGITKFTYDPNHLLLTATDPRNGVVTNVYDSSNRVTSQKDQLNRATTFSYTGDYTSAGGGTTTIIDPAGHQTLEQYAYGQRTSVTRGYGTSSAATTQYAYDPSTLAPTGITDADGHTTMYTYDANGNELSMTDPLGRQTAATYNAFNEPLTQTDGLNVTTTLTYDTSGNLTQVSTPLVGSSPVQSQTTIYAYGDNTHPGDVTAITNPDGKVSHLTYDTNGDLASSADPLGDTTTYTYNGIGWLTAQVSPKGNVAGCGCASSYTTTYGQDAFGRVTTTTDPLGHITTRHYDPDGNLDQFTDGDGNLTTYVYDAANEQTQVQRADSPQTTLVTDYNADGTILDQKDGAGNATTYGYDPLKRETSVTAPVTAACTSGCTTTYTYDGVGNLLTTLDSTGATTTDTYDADNELTAVSYSDGHTPNVTNITYDHDGQRTAMTDGTGTSSWVWDSLHRLTSSTNGAGQTVGYGYDLKGQLTSITYPGNHVVQRTYDDAGGLASVTDWLSHTTSFTPDPDSNVIAEVNPNGTTATSSYDRADRLSSISDAPTSAPSNPFASFTYGRDNYGQVASVTSTGVPVDTHAYTYTPLNQVHGVDSQSYAYSAADNVVQLANGSQQAFDAADQLTATAPAAISLIGTGSGGDTGATKSVTVTLPTGIQANDQIFVATTQQSGKTVTTPTGYTQVTSVTSTGSPAANSLLYRKSAVGGETSVTVNYGSKFAKSVVAVVYRGVDPSTPIDVQSSATAAAATSVTTPSVTTTVTGDRLAFFGGAVGNASATSWTAPMGMTSRVQFAGNASSAAGEFDQTLGAPGATGTRTATLGVSAQLTGIVLALRPPVTMYAYDARGDRTSVTPPGGPATTLTYDEANRLTAYGTTASYSYNGDGLRASKTVNGVADTFTWDVAGGTPLLLVDSSTAATTDYIYGAGGAPIEQVTSAGAVDFYYPDQLGSTRVIADTSGVVVATFSYDAYGKQTGRTGTLSTPFLYAGQYLDTESGLYYMRARYYDPSTAQMLTRDPAVELTRSSYGYVQDNPLNGTDPGGMNSTSMSPDAQHCDMGGDAWVYCGNHDIHGANRDIWAYNHFFEDAPGHIVVSYQVCLGLCFTVSFQGGTITGSMTTGTGLPFGVMGRGPAVGWANLPAGQRCDTQLIAGGGYGLTGEASVGIHYTPTDATVVPGDWEWDVGPGAGIVGGAQKNLFSVKLF